MLSQYRGGTQDRIPGKKADTTDMLSEEQVTKRLEKLGYKSGEIRRALRDVGQVIMTATATAYFASLPEDKQVLIRSLPEQEVAQYIAEHRAEFSPMSQEAFDKIHDETWEDYFSAMAQ